MSFDNPNSPQKGAASKQARRLTKLSKETTPVTTQFKNDIYSKVYKFRKDKGLMFDQDVVRMAVAYFLEKNGY